MSVRGDRGRFVPVPGTSQKERYKRWYGRHRVELLASRRTPEHRAKSRRNNNRYTAELRPFYVRQVLGSYHGTQRSAFSDELVELKAALLRLKRASK